MVPAETTQAAGAAAAASSDQVAPRSVLDELMTAREIADILQLRVSTVEDYARRGLLPSLKVGRHRRFVRSQVEEVIAALIDEHAITARGFPAGERSQVGPRHGSHPRFARSGL
jgi:excisionase family DNA binding protein